jgi:protein-tyrosine phosphatase
MTVLSVLVVCTGNVCRSPAAQLVLSSVLDGTVEVTSAGTGALVGAPVAGPMARQLARRGLDVSGFVARPVAADLLESAELVLTMTRAHRAAVLELAPAALRRCLLFTEVAALAQRVPSVPEASDDAARLRAVVVGAGRARATLGGLGPDQDIEDPYGHDDDVHARVLDRIVDETDLLVTALRR